MKILVLGLFAFLAFMPTSAVRAEALGRRVVCDAVDSFDRESKLEVNVDTKVIRVLDLSIPAQDWKVLYSPEVACGHTVRANECEQRMNHNFDQSVRPHPAIAFTARCAIGGQVLLEENADLEINRWGDGTGSFICGRLSRNNRALRSCKFSIE